MDNDILSIVNTILLGFILLFVIIVVAFLDEINKNVKVLSNNCIKIENKTYCERGNWNE